MYLLVNISDWQNGMVALLISSFYQSFRVYIQWHLLVEMRYTGSSGISAWPVKRKQTSFPFLLSFPPYTPCLVTHSHQYSSPSLFSSSSTCDYSPCTLSRSSLEASEKDSKKVEVSFWGEEVMVR